MQTEKVAIVGIVILESVALIMGIDGAFLLPIVCGIAGLAGYEFGFFKGNRKNGITISRKNE